VKTRNEKILVVLLLLIVLGAGNYYGFQWLSHQRQALDIHYAELRADKAEAQVDLQKQALWAERKNWIEKHQPVLTDEGDARAQVLGAVLKGARDQHLEILEQTLNEVQHGPAGTRVNVAVKVKGTMQSLCAWLTSLQQPESFYAVSQLSLKADEDQKSMVCTLQLARYFKAGS
jgi:hypothetical protein